MRFELAVLIADEHVPATGLVQELKKRDLAVLVKTERMPILPGILASNVDLPLEH
jgi:hypothetical protein